MPWIVRILIALALLAFLGYFLIFVYYAVSLFRFPFDYDQGEGFELHDTLLHARGEWPYRNAEIQPFYTSVYPPVFHLATVPLVWVFGAHLWTGRLLSSTASLIAAAAIGYAVFRETRRSWLAVVAGLAFLASNYVYHIGPLFRQHMFMVMLETLTVLALVGTAGDDADRRKGRLIAGLVCLLLAGFTKQLAIATAFAAFSWLFLQNPRRAVWAGLGFTAIFTTIFLWINRATDGFWFQSTILANVNRTVPGQIEMLFGQWFGLHYVLLLAAALRVIYETYFARISIYSLWFFFGIAVATLSGKFGAGESYFVTSIAAACVLSGLAFGEVLDRSRVWRPALSFSLACAIPMLYLWQARLVLHLPTRGPIFGRIAHTLNLPPDSGYYDSQGYTQLGRPPDSADIEAGWRIAEIVGAARQPVLSEEAGFPLAVGAEVVANPFPLLVMYEGGLFNPAEMVRQIDSQAYGVVIFRAQFYPPPVLQAIGAAYEPWQEIQMNGFTYRILRPREDR